MGKKYEGPILQHPLANLKAQESVNIGNPATKGILWPDRLSAPNAGSTSVYEDKPLGELKKQALRKL